MRLYALRTGIVKVHANIVDVILESLKTENLQLKDDDVLAIASKIIASAEGRITKLRDVKPSQEAEDLARKYSLTSQFAELILREADQIYGGVERSVLTLKNGILTANAGVDKKNVPPGSAILWPKKIEEWTNRIRHQIISRTGRRVAVLIVDSGLVPLRMGTKGLALAVAGFKPVTDLRGEMDIYGKPLTITRHAVADDLASAAHLLMGEAAQKTPIVLIRDTPIVFDGDVYGPADMMIPAEECIFMNSFSKYKAYQKVST